MSAISERINPIEHQCLRLEGKEKQPPEDSDKLSKNRKKNLKQQKLREIHEFRKGKNN
jgi:hypothetical protein